MPESFAQNALEPGGLGRGVWMQRRRLGQPRASLPGTIGLHLARALLLFVLVLCGTAALTRMAPGYFDEAAEMDAQHGHSARARLATKQAAEGSGVDAVMLNLRGWMRGDLGRSRQYDVPVAAMLRPRLLVSVWLLARGLAVGWLLALAAALPVAAMRPQTGHGTGSRWRLLRSSLPRVPFTLLLPVPAGALATLCLITRAGGAVEVLVLAVAAREFLFLEPLFRSAWRSTAALQARAQGLGPAQLLRHTILPTMGPQLGALLAMSVVTALSSMLPIEVLFDVHGVEQFAWNAALNRDLPVLIAVTALLAAVVALTGTLAPSEAPAHATDLA